MKKGAKEVSTESAKPRGREVGSIPWIPENPADAIIGHFVETFTFPYRKKERTAYKLWNDGGMRTVYGCAVLDRKMEEAKPAIGDVLTVVFDGVASTKKKGQNAAKLFRVFIDKPSADEMKAFKEAVPF